MCFGTVSEYSCDFNDKTDNILEAKLQFELPFEAKVNCTANSEYITLDRYDWLLSWFLHTKVCTPKYMDTHTLRRWLPAHRISLCALHITHTHTHSFMSRRDCATLGMKAAQCPHFTSVLRCSLSSMLWECSLHRDHKSAP